MRTVRFTSSANRAMTCRSCGATHVRDARHGVWMLAVCQGLVYSSALRCVRCIELRWRGRAG